MNICLINPKYECGQRAHRIPLGLSYIAAVLKENGHEVIGYNLDVDPEPDYEKYDVYGVYVSTPMIKSAIEVIQKIKGRIILGGPHISANPEFAEQFKAIAVVGEGEYAFLDAINQPDKFNIKHDVGDLNKLPFPAKEVFDHGNYQNRAYAYAAIVASRGCPFRCRNCQPGLQKISPYRVRKPELVVSEMLELYEKHKVRDFSFEDSELIISKNWSLKFCEEIIYRFDNRRITFQGNARIHQLDDEVLIKLKEAGCRRLGLGVESGSQKVLDKCLNKDINLKTDLPNVNKVKQYGIESHVWIMIGIPGETEEDIRKTIDMVKGLDVNSVEINIATPWPGTYFYEDAVKYGWLSEEESKEYDEKRKSVFKTPYLTQDRVEELFEQFKKELKADGWIQWSHESNTFAKKPTMMEVLNKACRKLLRKEIMLSDFSIFTDWVMHRGKNK